MASFFKKAACAVAAFAMVAGASGCGTAPEPAAQNAATQVLTKDQLQDQLLEQAKSRAPDLYSNFRHADSSYTLQIGNNKYESQTIAEFTPKTAPHMTCVTAIQGFSTDAAVAMQCFPKAPSPAP